MTTGISAVPSCLRCCFWLDSAPPVHDGQFKAFVKATGHNTFAEIDLSEVLSPASSTHESCSGSLCSHPPSHPVDHARLEPGWTFHEGRRLAPSLCPPGATSHTSDIIRSSCGLFVCTRLCALGRQGILPPRSRNGNLRRRGGLDGADFPWRRIHPWGGRAPGTLAGRIFPGRILKCGRLRTHLARCTAFPAKRLWRPRHDRALSGNGRRPVFADARHQTPRKPAAFRITRALRREELDPTTSPSAQHQRCRANHQGRLASLRARTYWPAIGPGGSGTRRRSIPRTSPPWISLRGEVQTLIITQSSCEE